MPILGAHQPLAATWTASDLAVVTRTELWRLRAEEPEHVARFALAGPAREHGGGGAIGGDERSDLVAVPLADGRIDVFGRSGRLRTLAAPAKPDFVHGFDFSPEAGHGVLGVTRDGPTRWKRETTFFDLGSGEILGRVDGGAARFDATGKYVAARGGLATLDGKYLWKNPDGWKSRKPVAGGGDDADLQGDYVGRGWLEAPGVGRVAVFATADSVVLVEPTTKGTTTIAARCPGTPGTKVASFVDAEHGLVVSACVETMLVTDVARRTTTAVPVAKMTNDLPIHFEVSPLSNAIYVSGGRDAALTIERGTNRVREIPHEPEFEAERRVFEPRPDWRNDGRFHAVAGLGGLLVEDAGKKPIVRFHRERDPDAAPPPSPAKFSDNGCPPRRDGFWERDRDTETFTAYSSGADACVCRVGGCVNVKMTGRFERLMDARADGTVLGFDRADREAPFGKTIGLYRPGKPAKRAPLACRHGVLAGDGAGLRVFALCDEGDEHVVYELAGSDLAFVAKRPLPPITDGDDIIVWKDDTLVFTTVGYFTTVLTVPLDWVRDSTRTEVATRYRSEGFELTIRGGETTFAVTGDREKAAGIIGCWDGTSLRPAVACWK